MSRSRSRDRDRGRGRGSRSPGDDRGDNPQIYVGRLPRGLYERDLEDIFVKFGKIRSLLMKRGFAFIVSKRANFNRNSMMHHQLEMQLEKWMDTILMESVLSLSQQVKAFH